MANQIELFDRKRRHYLKGFLVGFVIFFLAWFLRFIFKANNIGPSPVHVAVFVILLLSLVVQAYFAINLHITVTKIKKDPKLYSALYNELVRLHELKAWRVFFFTCRYHPDRRVVFLHACQGHRLYRHYCYPRWLWRLSFSFLLSGQELKWKKSFSPIRSKSRGQKRI